MNNPNQMTPEEIRTTAEKARELALEIKRLEADLKALKGTLVEEGLQHPKLFVPTENGGHTLPIELNDGTVCRVTYPGKKLKPRIDPKSKVWEKLEGLLIKAGVIPSVLFDEVVVAAPIAGFRKKLESTVADVKIRKSILSQVLTSSTPNVSFEVPDNSEKEAA